MGCWVHREHPSAEHGQGNSPHCIPPIHQLGHCEHHEHPPFLPNKGKIKNPGEGGEANWFRLPSVLLLQAG